MTSNRATRRSAFISDSAYSVGDLAFPAVVTADYVDRSVGTFEIVFDLLGWTGGYDPISLTIDDNDIRAIRQLLDLDPQPDCSYTISLAALRIAIEALQAIVSIEARDPDNARNWTWKDFTRACIDIAVIALGEIEASNGTPSDS